MDIGNSELSPKVDRLDSFRAEYCRLFEHVANLIKPEDFLEFRDCISIPWKESFQHKLHASITEGWSDKADAVFDEMIDSNIAKIFDDMDTSNAAKSVPELKSKNETTVYGEDLINKLYSTVISPSSNEATMILNTTSNGCHDSMPYDWTPNVYDEACKNMEKLKLKEKLVQLVLEKETKIKRLADDVAMKRFKVSVAESKLDQLFSLVEKEGEKLSETHHITKGFD